MVCINIYLLGSNLLECMVAIFFFKSFLKESTLLPNQYTRLYLVLVEYSNHDKAQTILRIRAVSPMSSLLAYTKYGS